LITEKTRVIVPVHYAGVACDMDVIMDIAKRYNLLVVEDAAQAIDSYYKHQPLGGIGHLGCFSFHETKNIQCGEGGMLAINDERFMKRSEIIWEKGTNRAEFFRGEANKYGWVDIGSSFLPSEVTAAFLWSQIENLDEIQNRRKVLWQLYYKCFKQYAEKDYITLPELPAYATNNAHMFYLVCKSVDERIKLISNLKSIGVLAVFHYLSLHKSEYYNNLHDGRNLDNSDHYSDCLIRMPLYYELSKDEIINTIKKISIES
jgi:dTDP-4-amino-4,6-dideoxygalactose transaminase